jgi:hypothetical protein
MKAYNHFDLKIQLKILCIQFSTGFEKAKTCNDKKTLRPN